jgi:DNA-binding IclR family transcriptional regulator
VLVKENPGLTVPEIAEKMGIKQNYLYRVLPALAADGLVVKDGRGWKPKDAA